MRKSDKKLYNLIFAATIAAAYAVLTMALAPISYGPIQFRISEVLCILPFFIPVSAWGLFIGCAIANLMSTAGLLDIVFGSLATLFACLCIANIGKSVKTTPSPRGKRVFACAMPVIFNTIIIGAILAFSTSSGDAFFEAYLLFGAQIALGEVVVMFGLGLPLFGFLEKNEKIMQFTKRLS